MDTHEHAGSDQRLDVAIVGRARPDVFGRYGVPVEAQQILVIS